MAFVKLDCGILHSTLWIEREPRDVFITALLMASPYEVTEPIPQYRADSLERTGFVVQPGWYGFIQAAGPGIVRMAMADPELGMVALQKLGEPDPESRSSDYEGRRLVRVDGGYIVLNFMKYRDKDNTAAVRSQRYRERKKVRESAEDQDSTPRDASRVTRDESRDVTKAKAEAEAKAEAGKPKTKAPAAPWLTVEELIASGLTAETAQGFLDHRKTKKAKLTALAWKGFVSEVEKATGWTLEAAALKAIARNWISVEAAWLLGSGSTSSGTGHTNRQKAVEDSNRAVGRAWASKGADHAGQ